MAYNPKTGKGLGRYYDAEHRAFRARESVSYTHLTLPTTERV